jgi:hypothetical protein
VPLAAGSLNNIPVAHGALQTICLHLSDMCVCEIATGSRHRPVHSLPLERTLILESAGAAVLISD